MGGKQRWTPLDRDKSLAYELLLREQCPKCGTLPEDWQDQSTNNVHEHPVWAAVLRRCYGCQEVERVQETMPKDRRRAAGGFVALIPFDDLEFEGEPEAPREEAMSDE